MFQPKLYLLLDTVGMNYLVNRSFICNQILIFTFPLIGNYGIPNNNDFDEFGLEKNFESSNIHPLELLFKIIVKILLIINISKL